MDLPTSVSAINSKHLDVLKKNISLNKFELHELSRNNEKFVTTVQKLNNEAKLKISDDHPKHALVYLNQAEKILQYVASCGRNIDRNLIISVLHNEACCYQKLWELEKCSNYLQALIYNLSSHLRSGDFVLEMNVEQKLEDQKEASEGFLTSLSGKSIKNRIQLSKYYLQFCAINSQLKNHSKAVNAGYKAIFIIKALIKELHLISKDTVEPSISPITQITDDYEEYEAKKKIVSGISNINDKLRIDKSENYLRTARHFFKKWNIRKHSQKNEEIKENLKNFSIGNIMQMKSLFFQENKESTLDNEKMQQLLSEEKGRDNPLKIESYNNIINLVLLLSIGYFTIATELRLIASDKHSSQSAKKQSQQYRQSELYHLITIIITSIYVPYDMLFMRHIITSFNNHYYSDITLQSGNDDGVIMKEFDFSGLSEDRKKKDTKKQTSPSLFATSARICTEKASEGGQKLEKMDHFSNEKKKFFTLVKSKEKKKSSQLRVSSEIFSRSCSPKKKKFTLKNLTSANKKKEKFHHEQSSKKKLSTSRKHSSRSKSKKKQPGKKDKLKETKTFIEEYRTPKKMGNGKEKPSGSKNLLKGSKSTMQLQSSKKTPFKKNISKYYF